MKKFLHFEGLRGVAAFVVLLAHFKPTFCRNINVTILDSLGLLNETTRIIADNFLKIFYDGSLPVFIFWFMSAFVISIKLFNPERNRDNKYLIEATSKRYFRLAIPVFFSSLICFILIKTHLFQNSALAEYSGTGYVDGWLNKWYHFDEGFFNFLKTTLVEVFASGNSNYNTVLWTMSTELLGSFLCFALFAIFGKNKFRFVLYSIIISFLAIAGIREVSYFNYFVFVCGIMWCDVIHSQDENVYLRKRILLVFNSKTFPLLLLLSGFGVTLFSDTIKPLHQTIYYFFNYPIKAIGFTLLVNNFNFLKNIFSTKPFAFMGKISFSLYLIHIPILFTVGAYLFMYAGFNPEYKVALVFLIVSVLTILLSYLFTILVDKKSIVISDKVGKYVANK